MGRKMERIGPNKAAAEQRLREVLSARTRGIYIKNPRDENITFRELAQNYHEWSKVNNKSYQVNKRYFINQLTKHFGSTRLVDISTLLVDKWKVERSKQTGYTEVDRELACLKHMFKMASKEWKIMTENPAESVKLFKKTRKKKRFLSEEEISCLLAHLPEHQKPIIQFDLLTGLRKSNLLNLKWSQVDLTHGYFSIPAQEAKDGDDHEFPLSIEAIELLKSIPRLPESEFVFCKEDGKPYKDIYNGFKSALKRASIKDCTPHTLRHTMGSHLSMKGVDLVTLKDLMGHKDIQSTMRYAHVSPDHKREAISRMGKVVTHDTNNDTKNE